MTIDAPPEAVWPWLVQLGQDRAGFYSYDWLERAFGVDVHNATEIHPEWQQREAGELLRATQPKYLGGAFGPNLGWMVTEVEPGRAMVLQHWGAFVLVPTRDGRTRFIIRTTIGNRDTPAWAAALDVMVFELPHFIMERRMMLTIKKLAEAHAGTSRFALAVADVSPRSLTTLRLKNIGEGRPSIGTKDALEHDMSEPNISVVLNHLIETCRDGEKGFIAAAELVADRDAKALQASRPSGRNSPQTCCPSRKDLAAQRRRAAVPARRCTASGWTSGAG